jgi:hypothetical protein
MKKVFGMASSKDSSQAVQPIKNRIRITEGLIMLIIFWKYEAKTGGCQKRLPGPRKFFKVLKMAKKNRFH